MGLCCCRNSAPVKTEEETSLLHTSNNEETAVKYVSIFDKEDSAAIPLSAAAKPPNMVQQNIIEDVSDEEDVKTTAVIAPLVENKESANHHIYEGDIAKVYGEDLTKYYGILYGTTLNIYIRKPIHSEMARHKNIYDMINISQFYDIDTYKLDDEDDTYLFGITFADRSGEFDAEYFMFETEREQNEWCQAFKLVMKMKSNTEETEETKTNANATNDKDIIECEWISYEYNIYWAILQIHTTDLLIYRDNKKDHLHKRINLANYDTVTMIHNTDDTLLKYGFALNSNANPKLKFYSKSNYNRSKWVTHCDYIVTNNINPIPSVLDLGADLSSNVDISAVLKGDKHASIDSDDPLQQLLFVLQCYQHWIESKANFAFMWFIKMHLKSSHASILNDYHLLILNGTKHESECVDLGQCGYLKRNNRFAIDVDKIGDRKSLYFGYEDHANCALFQLLDSIHCYLYHDTSHETLSDRFILHTNCNMFGQDFTYYDEFKDAPHFVTAKYSDLKNELLQNPYYTLHVSDYYDFYLHALHLRQSQYVRRRCLVKDHGIICDIQGIEEEAVLSINHLLSLLLYAKHDSLRRLFVKHCRKNTADESNTHLNERHSLIANWRRYLFETCLIFGDTLDANEFVCCAVDNEVNKPFIFDSFDVVHFVPASMTFATNQMDDFMMFKLEKADDKLCKYFDMRFISDHDDDKLFCGVRLKINDIIIQNKSHATEIAALQLLEMILRGNLFYFEWNQNLYAAQSQDMLVKFIENYLNNEDDDYFQCVFNKILNKYFADNFVAICISFQQISALNEDLMQYFVDMNRDDFKGRLFVDNENINVRFLEQPHVINVTQKQLELWRNKEYFGNIDFDEFQVTNGKTETFTFYLQIEKQLDEDNESDEDQVQISFHCKLYLKSCPAHIIKAKLFWDFVCTELQFENIQKAAELQRNSCDTINDAPLYIQSINNTLTFMLNIKLFS